MLSLAPAPLKSKENPMASAQTPCLWILIPFTYHCQSYRSMPPPLEKCKMLDDLRSIAVVMMIDNHFRYLSNWKLSGQLCKYYSISL